MFNHIKYLKLDRSANGATDKSNIGARMCSDRGTPAIEVHIEHIWAKYDAKRHSTHQMFPVLTIDEAIELRTILADAIADAKCRQCDLEAQL